MKPETNDFLIARRRSVVATAKAEGLFGWRQQCARRARSPPTR